MRARAVLTVWMPAVLLAGCVGPVGPEGQQLLRSSDSSLRSGDNAAAVDSASRFIRAYPRHEESAEAYYLRGVARDRMNQVDAARDDLAEALARTRRKDLQGLAHMALGNIAYQASDLSVAEKHYRAMLVVTPPGVPPADEAAFLLGCILQRQGKWSDADLFFDRVMHLFEGTDLAQQAVARVHAVRWTIQAGAYDSAVPAEELHRRLKAAGLPATIANEQRGGRMMRLVQVGWYPAFDAAQADLPKVKPFSQGAFATPAR